MKADITLESDDGRERQFEVSEDWLMDQGIDEGDEWPEDIDGPDEDSEKAKIMSAWMDNYMDALREMDEEFSEGHHEVERKETYE